MSKSSVKSSNESSNGSFRRIFLQCPCGVDRVVEPRKLDLKHDVYENVVPCEDGTCKSVRVSISEELRKFKCSDFSISALRKAGVPLEPVTLAPSAADIGQVMAYADGLSAEFENDPSKFVEPKNDPS